MPPTLTARNSAGSPGERDLRGEVHDAVRAVDRPRDDSRSVTEPSTSVAPVDPGRAPLERAHLVAGGDELGGDGAAEEPARAGDEHPHGATGLRAGEDALGPRRQPRPVDLRVVPDVGGQLRHDEHRGERQAGAPRTARASSGSARPARAVGGSRLDDGDDLPQPVRARRRRRRRGARASTRSTCCSGPTGVIGPSAVTITCGIRPSTHSRPRSSRCPTSPVRCHRRRRRPSSRPSVSRTAARSVSHSRS